MTRTYDLVDRSDVAAALSERLEGYGFELRGEKLVRKRGAFAKDTITFENSMPGSKHLTLRPIIATRFGELHRTNALLLGEKPYRGPTVEKAMSAFTGPATPELDRRYRMLGWFFEVRERPRLDQQADNMTALLVDFVPDYLTDGFSLKSFVDASPTTFSLRYSLQARLQIVASFMIGRSKRAENLLGLLDAYLTEHPVCSDGKQDAWRTALRERFNPTKSRRA